MESGTSGTAKDAFIILAKSQGLLPDDFEVSKTHDVATDYMEKSLAKRMRFDVVGQEVNRLLAAFVCSVGDYSNEETKEVIGEPPERVGIGQYRQNAFALLSGAVMMAAMSDTDVTVEDAMRGVICDNTRIMDGISDLSTAWVAAVGGKYDRKELTQGHLQECFDGLHVEWVGHSAEFVEVAGQENWMSINSAVTDDSSGIVNRCGLMLMNLLTLMNTTGAEVNIGMAVAVEESGDVQLMPPIADLEFLSDKDKEYLTGLFSED